MSEHPRRTFLKLTAGATAAGCLPWGLGMARSRRKDIPFRLGMASYTLRAFTLDQALEMTKRLGLERITLKDMHLPLDSTEVEIRAAVEKIKSAGLSLSSCGVVYMKNEEEVRRAFAYARAAGISMMVGAPDASLLDPVERCVKETGIALAIHNHGPGDERFPSPESAYRLVKGRDPRMGLCIDVGHTARLGLDPAGEAERFFDRLLDVHLKDVSARDSTGTTIEIGRGVIDIGRLLGTLLALKYSGTLHFEYEKDEKDPLPGVAESVGYTRGVLSVL